MISNVLKETVGKEMLFAKNPSYHLNCNLAEFLIRAREPSVLARFMRVFNVEENPPQHKTIRIFEALLDAGIDFFRVPHEFKDEIVNDVEGQCVAAASLCPDYQTLFARWMLCLGSFVIDNIEEYFYEETIFTQRILCLLCGKKYNKNIHEGLDKRTTDISPEILVLRDRYFNYLTHRADLGSLVCHKRARFVIFLSLDLAASLQLKKVVKKILKFIFGETSEDILKNPDSFVVVDAAVRAGTRLGYYKKCSSGLLAFVDKVVQYNPGLLANLFLELQDKSQFIELYERLSDEGKFNLDLLTRNQAVATACLRFDQKQNDFIEKLKLAMKLKETETNNESCEENFIFAVRNNNLGPTFKVICGFKANQEIIKSFENLSTEELFNLACSDHVHLIEAVISSDAIGEKVKTKVLCRLLGVIEKLAVSKFGSRLLDAVIVHCQIKTIKMIATELAKYKNLLLSDRFGKFIFLHWGLKYFEDKDKSAWTSVISNSKERKQQKLLSVLATL